MVFAWNVITSISGLKSLEVRQPFVVGAGRDGARQMPRVCAFLAFLASAPHKPDDVAAASWRCPVRFLHKRL